MDHKHLYEKGEWMDQDMNKYDLNHIVSHHPTMSREVWEEDLLESLEFLLFGRAYRNHL